MPIYNYKCKKCKNIFEVFFRSLSNKKVVKCEKCGSKDVIKQPATFSFSTDINKSSSGSSNCGTCSSGTCNSC